MFLDAQGAHLFENVKSGRSNLTESKRATCAREVRSALAREIFRRAPRELYAARQRCTMPAGTAILDHLIPQTGNR